ncbi:MAG: putative metallopeptidase [Nitrospiria bacterium]
MEYFPAPDVEEQIGRIIRSLAMNHIDPQRVRAVRSRGTRSRRILARCHALPKALQTGLNLPAHYVIELITENYNPLPDTEKTKTLIHELLHIPQVFGGGFRNHDYVRSRRVSQLYEEYIKTVQFAAVSPPKELALED